MAISRETQKKKVIPTHAYSFSAAILLGVTSTALYLYGDNKDALICAIATTGCIAHGLKDLYEENRLGKAFGLPFFKHHINKISDSLLNQIGLKTNLKG